MRAASLLKPNRRRSAQSPLATFFLVLLALALQSPAIAQGVVGAIGEAVRDDSGDNDDDGDDWDDEDCCDDDCDDSIWGELAAYVLTAPWWVPHVVADPGLEFEGYFPSHPYDEDVDGYMMIQPYVAGPPRRSATRLSVEYASDLDQVDYLGGGLLWETTSRFGIDTEAFLLTEELPVLGDQELWRGDANVVFRFVQHERLVMRTGLGLNWLTDDIGTEAGFNFTYGGDWFPCDPVVVSAGFDLGSLGDATLFHGRTTIGAAVNNTEFYTGVDYFRVDDIDVCSLIAGLRVWF
jgi:hypothetical protein